MGLLFHQEKTFTGKCAQLRLSFFTSISSDKNLYFRSRLPANLFIEFLRLMCEPVEFDLELGNDFHQCIDASLHAQELVQHHNAFCLQQAPAALESSAFVTNDIPGFSKNIR